MSGRVKLHRCSVDNELYFSETFNKRHAWQDIILNANHKDATIFIRGNEIHIKRGQIGWSEITMSKRWTRSRDKVRRFLKWLETRQQIEQQKSKVTTVITVKNYDKYQENDTTDKTTDKQQTDSRQDTNKNDKKEKNDKNEKKINKQDFLLFREKYPNKKSKPKAKEKYDAIIKSGKATVEQISEGLEKYLKEIKFRGTEKIHIKHPTTWLNQGCWEDEYDTGQKIHTQKVNREHERIKQQEKNSSISIFNKLIKERDAKRLKESNP